MEEAAELLKPARDELIRQAAQGEVVHNDHTSMRVLRLAREPSDERTGVFTSGIISTGVGRKIALYFTRRQHAGENNRSLHRPRQGACGFQHRAGPVPPLILRCSSTPGQHGLARDLEFRK